MIAKAMYVLRPVFYAGQTGWRQAEGVYEGDLQRRAEKEIAEELVPGESRVFHEPLRRLCKTMATEEPSFITDEEKNKFPEVIKDKVPLSKAYQQLVLLIPADKTGMIKDEIRLQRVDISTFAAFGP